ncbi:MAG: LysR family transcriptional regulator [Vicinamibacteria bacterium]
MKTELELRHLRIFVAVVEAGTYTGAAKVLGLSQSTVSETLSALERTLGTAIFRKVAKGSVLTPSGEALLPHAHRILDQTSELIADLAKVSTSVIALLTVGTVESLSAYVLPSHLAAWRSRWPKARVEVVTSDCTQIRESVAAGKYDLGLTLEAGGGSDGVILAKGRLVIFASPSHALARREASTDQVGRCEIFMSDAAGNYHQVLRQLFEAAQIPSPRTQALGSIEGVKRGVLASGTALGLLPAHAVEQELRDGVLAEVTVRPQLPGLVLRAVRAPGSAESPMIEDLVQSLRHSPISGRRPLIPASL